MFECIVTTASLPLSLCRMASGSSVKVWVKLAGRRATKVVVPLNADVDDIVKKVIVDENVVDIVPGRVSILMEGRYKEVQK